MQSAESTKKTFIICLVFAVVSVNVMPSNASTETQFKNIVKVSQKAMPLFTNLTFEYCGPKDKTFKLRCVQMQQHIPIQVYCNITFTPKFDVIIAYMEAELHLDGTLIATMPLDSDLICPSNGNKEGWRLPNSCPWFAGETVTTWGTTYPFNQLLPRGVYTVLLKVKNQDGKVFLCVRAQGTVAEKFQ